jgi:hypothetical protein
MLLSAIKPFDLIWTNPLIIIELFNVVAPFIVIVELPVIAPATTRLPDADPGYVVKLPITDVLGAVIQLDVIPDKKLFVPDK